MNINDVFLILEGLEEWEKEATHIWNEWINAIKDLEPDKQDRHERQTNTEATQKKTLKQIRKTLNF